MKRRTYGLTVLVVLLVIAAFAAYRLAPPDRAPSPAQAAVTGEDVGQVVDGDTITLATGEKVRLLGIDTPELGQPGADIAKDILEGLLRGQKVKLEKETTDKDVYGRLLRWVYALPSGVCVNAEMVRKGYAINRFYPPDTARREEFERLQAEAEKSKRALWAFGVFQPAGISVIPEAPVVTRKWKSPDEGVISWKDAADYYGEIKTVEGVVVATHNSGKACFLNFHPDYRTHFTAVIFASDFHKFPANPEDHYLHKEVRVKGLVKEYRGKPEIILQTPNQIEIAGE
ncbi:MAG: hypothetical protein GTN65_07840 [Armatimonadetes bacterium]|nr:hypothetical protein [Armatimonadota bacterium]NIO96996.1 hypothetical protein [Armatimonadota bacterium]